MLNKNLRPDWASGRIRTRAPFLCTKTILGVQLLKMQCLLIYDADKALSGYMRRVY